MWLEGLGHARQVGCRFAGFVFFLCVLCFGSVVCRGSPSCSIPLCNNIGLQSNLYEEGTKGVSHSPRLATRRSRGAERRELLAADQRTRVSMHAAWPHAA